MAEGRPHDLGVADPVKAARGGLKHREEEKEGHPDPEEERGPEIEVEAPVLGLADEKDDVAKPEERPAGDGDEGREGVARHKEGRRQDQGDEGPGPELVVVEDGIDRIEEHRHEVEGDGLAPGEPVEIAIDLVREEAEGERPGQGEGPVMGCLQEELVSIDPAEEGKEDGNRLHRADEVGPGEGEEGLQNGGRIMRQHPVEKGGIVGEDPQVDMVGRHDEAVLEAVGEVIDEAEMGLEVVPAGNEGAADPDVEDGEGGRGYHEVGKESPEEIPPLRLLRLLFLSRGRAFLDFAIIGLRRLPHLFARQVSFLPGQRHRMPLQPAITTAFFPRRRRAIYDVNEVLM